MLQCRLSKDALQARGKSIFAFLARQPEVAADSITVGQNDSVRTYEFNTTATTRDQLLRLAQALQKRFNVALQAKVPFEQQDDLERLQTSSVFG
ncbi:MAG: hypothetical protein PHX87_06505 [Candidatus Peribacteraceae bacterium]|nr:hypothetical protein [Candidatus Peribacteraceae bacterium]MDD5743040.1 hypothetical protein [Candidatus Peribacteraceae bacterium]